MDYRKKYEKWIKEGADFRKMKRTDCPFVCKKILYDTENNKLKITIETPFFMRDFENFLEVWKACHNLLNEGFNVKNNKDELAFFTEENNFSSRIQILETELVSFTFVFTINYDYCITKKIMNNALNDAYFAQKND